MFNLVKGILEKNYLKKLMFLTMLFGLMFITTETVSAQNSCSKKSDGKQIDLMVGNATGKPFTLNLVDQKCKEIPSKQQVPKDDLFHFTSYNDAVFRVREVGTNKLLGEIIVNPAKPEMLIQTDLEDTNARIMYLEPSDNTAAKSENTETDNGQICSKKLSDKPITIKWLNKTNESLQIRMIDENCQEGGGEYLKRNETFETTAETTVYPGYVFHIYKIIESDEGGIEDFKTITVTESNGEMTLKGPNSLDENPVSNIEKTTDTTNDNIEAFGKKLIGKWKSKVGEAMVYNGKTLTSYDRYGDKGVTKAYRISDEKTILIAISDDYKYASRSTITFKDENTMLEYISILNDTIEYKRVR